ncbi:MAG: restriction endonuclease subunit S, partial [Acidobacteriota bacterium]
MLDVEEKMLAKRTLQRGDIIIERSGGGPKQPVGRVCYFDASGVLPFSFSNFTTTLRVKNRNRFLPLFVHYYLLYLYQSGYTAPLQRATTGIRNLDFEAYLNAKLPEIPLEEQRTIVTVLHKTQRAINIEERLRVVADDLKKSGMHKLFTHGLRDEAQKVTDLGPVPESWEVVALGDVCSLSTGTTPATKRPDYYQGSIPFIKTSEIVNNRLTR